MLVIVSLRYNLDRCWTAYGILSCIRRCQTIVARWRVGCFTRDRQFDEVTHILTITESGSLNQVRYFGLVKAKKN